MALKMLRQALAAAVLLPLMAACAQKSLNAPSLDPTAVAREREVQQDLVFEEQSQGKKYDRLAMVYDAGYRLRRAALPFCGGAQATDYGFLLHDGLNGQSPTQSQRNNLKIRVFAIAKGSPAAKSDLKTGEQVISLNNKPIAGMSAAEIMAWIEENASSSLRLGTKDEKGKSHTRIIPQAQQLCRYPIAIKKDSDPNAYADGAQVVVHTGLVDFVDHEEELAFVLAHEISHNALGHVNKSQVNATIGTLADMAIGYWGGVNTGGLFGQVGVRAYSKNYEQEADYMGLYILARAGYDAEKSKEFFRRLGVRSPEITQPGGFLATHPSTPERFVAMEATIREIEAKQRAGQPLMPNQARD